MAGKLIVIDGTDASGKQTQSLLLTQLLLSRKEKVMHISFPNYEEDYCAPVKMYLAGDFGQDPSSVNPYAASTFYAVDRFCSYKQKWQKFYEEGGILVADRYTTSNAIHQGGKLTGQDQHEFFLWLYDFEFNKIGLPKPDCVVFLDMPPGISKKLMDHRANKATGEDKKDIHEQDEAYQRICHRAALDAAEFYGWNRISCIDEKGCLKPIEQITKEIDKVTSHITK